MPGQRLRELERILEMDCDLSRRVPDPWPDLEDPVTSIRKVFRKQFIRETQSAKVPEASW